MAVPDNYKGGKKRKLGKASNSQPQKRRKGNNAKAKQPTGPRRVVAPEELKWKAVDVPEMFADAEGFFGLEEIEGVDIVRSGNTFQFVTTAPSSKDDDEFEGFDDSAPETPGAPSSGSSNGQTDEIVEPAKGAKPAKKKASEDKRANGGKKPKEEKKVKGKKGGSEERQGKDAAKKGKVTAAAADSELAGGGFAMLAGMDDDAENDSTDVSAWVPLDIVPPLLSCLARLRFSKPSAIQSATIPAILAGRDVIGKASTGSGKTLAFAIPIVQRWLADGGAERRQKRQERQSGPDDSQSSPKSPACSPTALVLSPTRELAHQITTHIKELCAALPSSPYVCAVTGGLSVFKQQRQLEKADIVVGTPGRLWEVLSTSKPLLEAFKSIDFLVIDEADRLLSDGHFKEAEEILEALDRVSTDERDGETEADNEDGSKDEDDKSALQKFRQTLVFSATFNKGLQQKLAGKSRYDLMDQKQSMDHLLKRLNFREENPTFIDVNPVSQMAERLREGMVECGAMEKDLYLYALLLLQPTRRTLVFANSISTVRRLAPLLQNLNLPAIPLHSQMPQKARLRAVERFKAAQSDRGAVLIATDVAARGLDIPGIDVVIHYHVPRTADNYVHRSGRTARAASAGLSILLCGPEEVVPTRRLVAKIHAAASLRDEDEGADEDEDVGREEEEEEQEGAAKGKVKGKDKAKETAPVKKANANGTRKNKHNGNNSSFYIRSIDIDRRLVSRLKERLVLAKKLADSTLAKEKGSKDDSWMREAAEELGVEYDSDDGGLERAGSWSGRGSGRRSREKASRELGKAELGALRAELRELLSRRVNVGVSERYLTSGGINVDELLRSSTGDFLGRTDGLGMDELC